MKNKKINQFRAFLALSKASIIASIRNKNSLFFNFFFPFVFITIFGILGNGSSSFTIGVRPGSLSEGVVYEALKKVDVLKLDTSKTNDQITDDLNKGRLAVALTIKQGNPLVAGGTTIPTYTLDIERSAADPQESQAVVSIIDAVVGGINNQVLQNAPKLVTSNTSVVEGRKFKQIDFILPGQLAFALLMNALFGISMTFISYKKELILKRLFATPVKKSTIMASEVSSRIIIGILQSLIIIAVGYYAFGFTLANGLITVASMLLLSLVGLYVFLGLGLFVAAVAKDENSASPIANLVMMPQLFLSGAFFPIEAFPSFLQPVAKVMPMTLLNESFKKVAFEGLPLTETLPAIAGLLIWGTITYIVVSRIFKWE